MEWNFCVTFLNKTITLWNEISMKHFRIKRLLYVAKDTWHLACNFFLVFVATPRGSEWIISVGDYVDNSFTALGSNDPREVRL